MAVSFALRMALVLAGFYLVMQGQWERLAVAMVGFLLVREILLRRLGKTSARDHRRNMPMEIVAIDQISPDQVILFAWGFVTINATLLYTWLIMGLLVIGSIVITGNLSSERTMSRWQNLLEVIVGTIRSEDPGYRQGGSRHILPLHRDAVSLHPLLQPVHLHPGVRGADLIPDDDGGPGRHGVHRRPDLRDLEERDPANTSRNTSGPPSSSSPSMSWGSFPGPWPWPSDSSATS